MRPLLPTLALVLLLAACSPGEEAQPRPASAPSADPGAPAISITAPPAFQGEWNADLAACGGGGDESRLTIGADTIGFYESQGQISATRLQGEGRLAVEAMMSGEGETWVDSRVFQISEDGQTLTDVTEGSTGMVRRRCP
ncbi:hypothetical protein [Phenylobacterium sp.]|uniref:hypothetical protein n=1 Tax=Phenylobacterium sp. TaxID=1871053 RepID=UPI002731BA37|nr:hypothetical protein [Phenylobacterium sp.]MDP1619185.1 hypothetical protein [Phenylobacterium sp.]MDP1987280.1 hypothetical protein [Phenylobacterium sp.]